MGINRKQILDELLEIIWIISDKSYQQRIWIMGLGPECDSYDETINEFYSVCDAIIEEWGKFGISQEQLNVLVQFKSALSAFSRKYDLPQEFINSFEWAKIMEMATEALDAFYYPKKK
jgi:hypothetical protein